jgi:hypothetical protein
MPQGAIVAHMDVFVFLKLFNNVVGTTKNKNKKNTVTYQVEVLNPESVTPSIQYLKANTF